MYQSGVSSARNSELVDPKEHQLAFIYIRDKMMDEMGIKKMASDFSALANKQGLQVAIGPYMNTTKLVAVSKSARELEQMTDILIN